MRVSCRQAVIFLYYRVGKTIPGSYLPSEPESRRKNIRFGTLYLEIVTRTYGILL